MDPRHQLVIRNGLCGEPKSHLFPNYWANREGLWIYTRRWEVNASKGLVFLCHGFGEHINRYVALANRLTQAGYSVYGMDHQGHGLSQGF